MQAPLQEKNVSDTAHTDTARRAGPERTFADIRPAAVAQRELRKTMNGSPRVLQQQALSDTVQNGPRMVAQRHEMNALFGGVVKPQGDGAMAAEASPAQREEKTNNTGLPNQLKSGIESLSGMSMDHVKVHYNSDKPAQLQAHAYAQGSEIHVAPGQEKHLPHEAWHVVQQAQGRVRPTLQMKGGVGVNDEVGLEGEADLMGEKAMQFHESAQRNETHGKAFDIIAPFSHSPMQCYIQKGGQKKELETLFNKEWGAAIKKEDPASFEDLLKNFVEYCTSHAQAIFFLNRLTYDKWSVSYYDIPADDYERQIKEPIESAMDMIFDDKKEEGTPRAGSKKISKQAAAEQERSAKNIAAKRDEGLKNDKRLKEVVGILEDYVTKTHGDLKDIIQRGILSLEKKPNPNEVSTGLTLTVADAISKRALWKNLTPAIGYKHPNSTGSLVTMDGVTFGTPGKDEEVGEPKMRGGVKYVNTNFCVYITMPAGAALTINLHVNVTP